MEHKKLYLKTADGNSRRVKGCLFDFDGVIVDTERYHHQAWNVCAKKLDTQLTWEEYLPLKSTSIVHIVRFLAGKSGISLTDEQIQEIGNDQPINFQQASKSLSPADILPGVESFLKWLKDNSIAVAVASSAATSSKIAADFGLNRYFDAMFDGNTKMPRKPAPDVFLTAAKAIGIDPKDCIVFEDSLAGIDAAVNANINVIAVGGILTDKCVAHIKDFTEIWDLFYCE